MREVNVLWLRILMPVVTVGLLVSLAVYQDPARRPDEPFEPFDPYAFKDSLYFGDPITTSEWIGELNVLAAFGYVLGAFAPGGRRTVRGIAIGFAVAGALGLAGLGGLSYLAATDPASFPIGSRGMVVMFTCHAAGLATLAGAWWQVRRAALRPPDEADHGPQVLRT